MVAHIEVQGGRLLVKIAVTRASGLFEATIPMSATPVELELFLTQVRTIVKRRQKGESNGDPDAS